MVVLMQLNWILWMLSGFGRWEKEAERETFKICCWHRVLSLSVTIYGSLSHTGREKWSWSQSATFYSRYMAGIKHIPKRILLLLRKSYLKAFLYKTWTQVMVDSAAVDLLLDFFFALSIKLWVIHVWFLEAQTDAVLRGKMARGEESHSTQPLFT